MNIIFSEIPIGFDPSCHRETQSSTVPVIRRSNDSIFIPVFVREERKEDSVSYKYFDIEVPFECQDLSDYRKLCMTCYAHIRKALYGSSEWQQSMRDDFLWEAHRLAVRSAFPKHEGEVQPGIERFNGIKQTFWSIIDEACKMVGKTREDLPPVFTGEELLEYAIKWGITGDTLISLTTKITICSINLLQNNRNWKELF